MAIEPPLQDLIDTITGDVADLMTDLEAADLTAATWRDRMAATLARGHLAAYMTGQGSEELDADGQKQVLRMVTEQLTFLDRFAVEVQGAAEFQRGWNSRAAMYVESIGQSFYRGQFRMWPLPSVPRDGSTQCLSRCNCSWEIDELEGEGNADCYWRMGPSEHCQSCQERARQWSPLRIRNNELL